MIERVPRLTPVRVAAVTELMNAEEQRTDRRPLDEVNRLAIAGADAPPREHWLMGDPLRAYGIVTVEEVAEVAAATPEDATDLLSAIRAAHPAGSLWCHGDRATAHLAARTLHLPCLRELVLLARDLPLGRPERALPAGIVRSAFDPDVDSADWLALNRTAFADLPDQASWTAADLDLRLAAPWFDRSDFHIARAPDGSLAGFHWTKVDPDAAAGDGVSGEVFVIAVAPQWRGSGLAGSLLDHGLAHLAQRGMAQAHLFVDSTNEAALALYERAGFRRVDRDRQYALRQDSPTGGA